MFGEAYDILSSPKWNNAAQSWDKKISAIMSYHLTSLRELFAICISAQVCYVSGC